MPSTMYNGLYIAFICDLFTAGTTVLVYCKEALSCHQGCTVGYKCDTIGCPTCSCIKPSGMYTYCLFITVLLFAVDIM